MRSAWRLAQRTLSSGSVGGISSSVKALPPISKRAIDSPFAIVDFALLIASVVVVAVVALNFVAAGPVYFSVANSIGLNLKLQLAHSLGRHLATELWLQTVVR